MQPKSNVGKTNKYSNVAKAVRGDKAQEEPRITPEQVIAAFRSFGFEPNERNHNDIGYWTMKGQSEGVKLMEELHKRRMELNKQEDEHKKSQSERERAAQKAEDDKKTAHETIVNKQHIDKAAMPRLSDEDINALFDEYGLPAPDPEWARNHLPNDPKKIRSILEMQRKTADDLLKKHSKNTVNSMPETPKMPGSPMMAAPMQGRGGPMPSMGQPGPMGMQAGMVPDDSPATPFFIGDHSIVRITNPTNPNASTLWLVDAKKKVLRPFLSEQAFQNAFENPEEAEKAVVTISTRELGKGGALDGFKPLQGSQGVNDDGSMEDIEYSPAQIQKRYGKPSDPTAENKALSMLDGVLGSVDKTQPQI